MGHGKAESGDATGNDGFDLIELHSLALRRIAGAHCSGRTPLFASCDEKARSLNHGEHGENKKVAQAYGLTSSFRRKPESSVFLAAAKALDPGLRRDDDLRTFRSDSCPPRPGNPACKLKCFRRGTTPHR
jgi:hypothetical protein